MYEEDNRLEETIPYIDPSFFSTGTENHIFIPKGIRTVGINAKNQTLFTTNNPKISLAVWVREVLKGNYLRYLEGSAAAFHHKRRLKTLAAPALLRFREFFQNIVRDEVYRKKVDRWYRTFKTDAAFRNDAALQRKFAELYAETDWLEKEYHLFTAESSGFFSWKKISGNATPRPFFRLESESKIKKLQVCVGTFTHWEESFTAAVGSLEREFPADETMKC